MRTFLFAKRREGKQQGWQCSPGRDSPQEGTAWQETGWVGLELASPPPHSARQAGGCSLSLFTFYRIFLLLPVCLLSADGKE